MYISRIADVQIRDMYISEISFRDIMNLIRDIMNSICDITNWIHDITKSIRDMYISRIQITHIANSGLNSKTAFHTVMWEGLAKNIYTANNLTQFTMHIPKLIKVGGNLTKFWEKQKCTVFWDAVYIFIRQTAATTNKSEGETNATDRWTVSLTNKEPPDSS